MTHRRSAILVGFWLALISSPAMSAPFCNISGSSENGVEFILAMKDAKHIAGSDYAPNGLILNDRKTGATKDYPAPRCVVHFFDPKSQIYLKKMHIRCSRNALPLGNIRYKYDPWKQSFVCTQACSKDAPMMLEFDLCNLNE